jgi:hypothetical protein
MATSMLRNGSPACVFPSSSLPIVSACVSHDFSLYHMSCFACRECLAFAAVTPPPLHHVHVLPGSYAAFSCYIYQKPLKWLHHCIIELLFCDGFRS